MKGEKEEEYTFEISLTGFFSFSGDEEVDDETKNELISKNAIAIIMPYLRSEVSLLTAQPEVECVVLPPFNINKMMENIKTKGHSSLNPLLMISLTNKINNGIKIIKKYRKIKIVRK